MPWFRVDDNLSFHAKTVRAGNSAMGLWVRAGSWCAQNLTDGHVPDHIVKMLGTRQQAAKLVSVRLWSAEKGGFLFHEWDERQPKREAIEAERAAARERMRSNRAAKKGTKPESPQASAAGSPELLSTGSDAFGNPNPTHPIPSQNTANEFEKFWDAYPRKIAKGAARKAWAAAVKKVTAAELLDACGKFGQRVTNSDPKFIPHPATWLNGERWADEVTNGPSSQAGPGEWFRPFTPPPCPADIADDPQRYAVWLEEQREAWRAEGGGT